MFFSVLEQLTDS